MMLPGPGNPGQVQYSFEAYAACPEEELAD